MFANVSGIDASRRLRSARCLYTMCDDWLMAREIEATVHAWSGTFNEYMDKMQQIVHNLEQNPGLVASYKTSIVALDDETMARGTLIEDIERESQRRRANFEAIVQEKYNMVNQGSSLSTLKCRRCGSGEVQAEQKQTRGADEAMTVFCTCSKCLLRWTMR